MGAKSKEPTRNALQIRMTVYVTFAVLLASSVILSIIAYWVREDYEDMLHERISDDLTAITLVMEQRLLRVESTTNTMAALACNSLGSEEEIDSLLRHTLEATDDVTGVSMIFGRESYPQIDGYYERYAYYDDDGIIQLDTYINGDEMEKGTDWAECYLNGEPRWNYISVDYLSGHDEVCYLVPLYGKNGNRIGIAYSAVLTSKLASFVTQHKLHKDIDISIYKTDSTMIVAPDDYILELSDKDLLLQESTIPHLGWRVVLSADKSIINRLVTLAMLRMLLLLFLMFVIITLAIRIIVRHVARPFVEKQQQTEMEKAVMENEMQLAAGAQKELIPHVFPPFPDRNDIELSACLHPARQVGGDLYDYFIHDGKLFFCIGDVSGKGVQASLFMAATHYLFRSQTLDNPIDIAAKQINDSLCTENELCRFVTFWMGCLDLNSGVLEYVNAGHDSPILLRNGRVETFPESENAPLGVIEEVEFVSGSTTLQPGDILFLYTDGISEAMDTGGHEFGKTRVGEALQEMSVTDTSDIVEEMLGRVRAHSYGAVQSDDITMLCLKYIGNKTNQI